MRMVVSQITGVSIVCSTVHSGTDQRKYQSSASLAFVKGIHRWQVDSPHNGKVTRKMFSFDDGLLDNEYNELISTCTDTLFVNDANIVMNKKLPNKCSSG